MNTQIDELDNIWASAKNTGADFPVDIDELIRLAKKKKRSTLVSHIFTSLILTITLLVISAFFFLVVNFQELPGKIGASMMMLVLLIRILIELFSIYRFAKIDLSQTALSATNAVIEFYNYRKYIQGPLSFSIAVLYTLGFFMLTPEFSQYFNWQMMFLIDGSYIIGAVILTWQIRLGIRSEMKVLADLIRIKSEMAD